MEHLKEAGEVKLAGNNNQDPVAVAKLAEAEKKRLEVNK